MLTRAKDPAALHFVKDSFFKAKKNSANILNILNLFQLYFINILNKYPIIENKRLDRLIRIGSGFFS